LSVALIYCIRCWLVRFSRLYRSGDFSRSRKDISYRTIFFLRHKGTGVSRLQGRSKTHAFSPMLDGLDRSVNKGGACMMSVPWFCHCFGVVGAVRYAVL